MSYDDYCDRKEINDSRVTFFIGDVRDYESVLEACSGIDYVFHAAALKQVPSCEFYPYEAVKTNIIGTENLLKATILNGIKKVVLLRKLLIILQKKLVHSQRLLMYLKQKCIELNIQNKHVLPRTK